MPGIDCKTTFVYHKVVSVKRSQLSYSGTVLTYTENEQKENRNLRGTGEYPLLSHFRKSFSQLLFQHVMCEDFETSFETTRNCKCHEIYLIFSG